LVTARFAVPARAKPSRIMPGRPPRPRQPPGVAPFAQAWLRAGTVSIGRAKMAKSTGNLVLVDELMRDYPPAAIRLLCLNRA